MSKKQFLAKLFAKGVSSKLKKNTDLQRAIDKTDKEIEKARDEIEKAAGDKENVKKAISPEVRKYLGFDY
ncbi:hypothetical protein [Gracilimonas sp.]|uniref:hypothetical protein n=1 Tax=Gracilimonas sp. TaxID=1974203 RepID=UPI0028722079|nr:hypothetical protein [Gracilimonas sp.]